MNRVEVVTGRAIYQAFSPPMLYMLGAIGLAAWGPVAQGIEQQPSKLKVAGSNPAGVANKIKCLSDIFVVIASQKS
jgi:hypothetical protein